MNKEKLPALLGFRVATDTDANEVVSFLHYAYGFEVLPRSIERTEDTVSSVVFRVSIQNIGPVILKRTGWFQQSIVDGYAEVASSLEFAYSVAENICASGVPLQRPFRGLDGKIVQRWEGLPTALFSCEEGESLELNRQGYERAGVALALFHKAGTKWIQSDSARIVKAQKVLVEMPYEESRFQHWARIRSVIESEHACGAPDICHAVRKQIQSLEAHMRGVDASGVFSPERVRGWLHNDFHCGNMLAVKDRVVIIDLDQSSYGPFIWDIGNTLNSFAAKLRSLDRSGEYEFMTEAFLKGYHSAHPLSLEEYVLIREAGMRWDLMRIMRGMRRLHDQENRLSSLLDKIPARLMPRLEWFVFGFGFLDREWLKRLI